MSAKEIVENLPVFAGVSKDRLHLLASRAEPETCHAHQVIYRTGEPCDGLYVVAEGGVLLRNETPGQPVDRVLDVAAGEVFGESEVMDGAARHFTARAFGTATVVWIPLEPLQELLRENSMAETLLRMLAVRRQTSRARARLAPSNRREPRIWVDRDVVIKTGRGESHRVRLIDLSNGGACIGQPPTSWKAGDPVVFTLGLPGRADLLSVRGIVRWRANSTVGISFEAAGSGHRRRIESVLQALVSR
ncbi:MAG TPA: cyclic nucleotide-binding domain-containing protein [Thermoanaerobaculia bacterium]|nr:cyclic nucleotide-binding domain-containing protein [Thermoanaerobaculia bacterium]